MELRIADIPYRVAALEARLDRLERWIEYLELKLMPNDRFPRTRP